MFKKFYSLSSLSRNAIRGIWELVRKKSFKFDQIIPYLLPFAEYIMKLGRFTRASGFAISNLYVIRKVGTTVEKFTPVSLFITVTFPYRINSNLAEPRNIFTIRRIFDLIKSKVTWLGYFTVLRMIYGRSPFEIQ